MIKLEIYEKEIREKFTIVFVIDDRQKVDTWRAQNLVVLQCAPGGFLGREFFVFLFFLFFFTLIINDVRLNLRVIEDILLNPAHGQNEK